MPTALALSPHLDDAVFSCGGTLALLAARGWRVALCTVFTASVPDPQGFALACQTDKGLPPDADYMALRRNEDRDAAAALGIEPPSWLAFREAPHRGYEAAPALFGETRDDDAVVEPVAAALADVVRMVEPDLLFVPQAIGGHVDHVQTVRALKQAGVDRPLLWWRDFPYSLREAEPKQPFAAEMEGLDEVEVVLDPGALARKREACLAYASQLGFQFGGAGGLDQRLAEAGAVERFRQQGAANLSAVAPARPALAS